MEANISQERESWDNEMSWSPELEVSDVLVSCFVVLNGMDFCVTLPRQRFVDTHMDKALRSNVYL